MIAMSLVIDRISMNYGHTKVLDNVSAIIQKGEFLSILGHSGCGKTTLLKILAGFIKPAEGQILLHGAPVAAKRVQAEADTVFAIQIIRHILVFHIIYITHFTRRI